MHDRRDPSVISGVVAVFANAAAAEYMVAGLPAAARALRTLAQAGVAEAAVLAPGLDTPGAALREEAARLTGTMAFRFVAAPAALQSWPDDSVIMPGEQLLEGRMPPAPGLPVLGDGPQALAPLPAAVSRAALAAAGARIIKATAKSGDGIVSRHLNRPISQACTRALFAMFPAIRPIHATFGTAALALAMAWALLTGTPAGLILGGLLFQAASIFDGVDGEIARATFRSSPSGAALDSLIDALTNLACVAGVAWNVRCQGQSQAALAGTIGLVAMGLGLWILGRHSRRHSEGMTFNAVKDRLSQRPSRLRQWLTWLTMRDFYALAAAVLIASGFAVFALYAFAIVAAVWLVVVVTVMTRDAA